MSLNTLTLFTYGGTDVRIKSLVKDSEIRVEHLIEDSLPGELPAITLRKKLMKLRFWEATDNTIIIKSLFIIQKTQPKPSEQHIFRNY
ncbi:hypothetical protein G9A89_016593 [Geosiphon pyriformis]|nr:hypothetical protein G9A89_016593 [Geosiphon pyriformis]